MEEQLKEFNKYISNTEMADRLNETALRYAQATMEQKEAVTPLEMEAEDIYWLIQLRDLFRKL
ncbi:MAG: hypothetical protein JXR60_05995 [Bacteroidales bacterium]|nr:hypothetical protein [Bacteroidales bacterium]